MSKNNTVLTYYKNQGSMTDPGSCASMLACIPDDLEGLAAVVQSCLVHIFWLKAYGLELPEERQQEVNLRSMSEKLKRLKELGFGRLTEKHARDRHLVANCRDYALFLCSLLRHKGIPARERCGFSRYFTPGKYEDHWICEYWNEDEKRWIMVDAQLDDLQREKLNIGFNHLDVPADFFIYGGMAWKLCRQNQADPDLFGFMKWWGIDYVKSNFVLDAASLRKMPMLPWDNWNGLKARAVKDLNEAEARFLDELAALSLKADENFTKIREVYGRDDAIRVPEDLKKVRHVLD